MQKIKFHSLEISEVLQKLQITDSGLSSDQVLEKRKEYGENKLPSKEVASLLKIFIQQFKSPLIYVLVVAAIVALFLQEFKDAIFIGFVLLINAVIGTYQEGKAEKNATALQNLITIKTKVKRDGKEIVIDSSELVPGDIVMLESGNRVPADIRVIRLQDLSVDESFLTGESVAVGKKTEKMSEDAGVADQKNMLFAGSTILSGRCVGVVTSTGINTEVGKISDAVVSSISLKAPLVIRMEEFAKQVSYVVLSAVVVLSIFALLQNMEYKEVFFFAIAVAVSAIPEGLPISITVALSIATNKMAKRNVIVRKLTAVEGLGSCTIIASDKTGTLTVNKQTLKKIALANGNSYDISGEGYNGTGEILKKDANDSEELFKIALVSAVCNEGNLFEQDGDDWEHNGDAIDVAFLAYVYKFGLNPTQLKKESKIIAEVPFESENKYSAVAFEHKGKYYLAAKGATETILSKCSNLDNNQFDTFEQQGINLAADGFRALALGIYESNEPITFNSNDLDSFNNFEFLGLAGFIDPLRPESKPSVELCKQAGVEVAMVTGDHPVTALAISKQLGIAESEDDVLTGTKLSELKEKHPEKEFYDIISNKRVFARVNPLQKMEIVTAFSERGHFVAVTGDGVNDVPALKKGNIGIAMGSGTDLAKDTAEIIITNDNFSSISAGIEEGRHAYENIRKVTYLLISTGAAEVTLFLLCLFAGTPLPLTAIQILWLNLVTNGIQDKALAFEAGEPENMKKPPRDPNEGMFNKLMIQQTLIASTTMSIVAFAAWYIMLDYFFIAEYHARTLLLLLVVFMQNIHVFNCRSEYRSAFKMPLSANWLVVIGVILAQGIHILAMNIPFMQDVLSTDVVTIQEWFILLGISLLMIPPLEIFKQLKKRYNFKVA